MLKGGLISILILLFPQKICRIFNFFTYLRLKSLHIFWGYQPKWKKSCNYMVSPNIWLEIKYINISFSSWNTQFTNSEFEHPQLKRSSRRKKDMPSNPLLIIPDSFLQWLPKAELNWDSQLGKVFSLPLQRNFSIFFKPKVAIAVFFWKMQRKTWYPILGVDAMPLSLKSLLLRCCKVIFFFFI